MHTISIYFVSSTPIIAYFKALAAETLSPKILITIRIPHWENANLGLSCIPITVSLRDKDFVVNVDHKHLQPKSTYSFPLDLADVFTQLELYGALFTF